MKLLTLVLLALCVTCSAELPGRSRLTGAGIPMGYQDNPYEYLFGNVVRVDFPKEGDAVITNLTFAPVGTYAMFTQQVPLCGDQSNNLQFRTSDVVVITMTQRMTRRYCHDLLRIDVVQKTRSGNSLSIQ